MISDTNYSSFSYIDLWKDFEIPAKRGLIHQPVRVFPHTFVGRSQLVNAEKGDLSLDDTSDLSFLR